MTQTINSWLTSRGLTGEQRALVRSNLDDILCGGGEVVPPAVAVALRGHWASMFNEFLLLSYSDLAAVPPNVMADLRSGPWQSDRRIHATYAWRHRRVLTHA